MLLEFYTKHNKLLILTFVLAAIGLYNVIIDSIRFVFVLSSCHGNPHMISIVCWIFKIS